MGRKHGSRQKPDTSNRYGPRPGHSSNNNTIFISGQRSINKRSHKWNSKPAQDNLGIIRAWVKVCKYKRVTLHGIEGPKVRLYVNGKHVKDINLNKGWEGRIMRVIEKTADKVTK